MNEQLNNQLQSSFGRKALVNFLTEKLGKSEIIDTFDRITDLYMQVNSVINISGLKTFDDIYIKHYLDSIYPCDLFSGTVCDVGCGGGFPSLPLAVVTGLPITGLDSVGKKLLLIQRCVTELGIKNITHVYARSEDMVKIHKSFNTVCARALADVDKALSLCAPLAAPGGKIILYRSQNDNPAKPQTVQKTGTTLSDVIDYVLPETDIKRRIMVYTKQ